VTDNGGTVVALAGDGYCLIAADTRLSEGYQIQSRNVSRIMKVRACAHEMHHAEHLCEFVEAAQASSRAYIGMAGSWADATALRREVSETPRSALFGVTVRVITGVLPWHGSWPSNCRVTVLSTGRSAQRRWAPSSPTSSTCTGCDRCTPRTWSRGLMRRVGEHPTPEASHH
jgi:hypothetical protein